MQLIKIVNYGKKGVYLYSAIVLIDNVYKWTEIVHFKDKKEKYKHDFLKDKIVKNLNEYSLKKYNLLCR